MEIVFPVQFVKKSAQTTQIDADIMPVVGLRILT